IYFILDKDEHGAELPEGLLTENEDLEDQTGKDSKEEKALWGLQQGMDVGLSLVSSFKNMFLQESEVDSARPIVRSMALPVQSLQKIKPNTAGQISRARLQERPADSGSRSLCKFCSDVKVSTGWKITGPEFTLVNENPIYRVSSAAGRYECSASGLRWVCDGDVSLKYHFSDWELYRKDLRRMQFEPCGPLMDITVISGVLTEVHLPHVACLGSSSDSLKDEVRVLDVQDGGMFLEKCELTRFHAKLLHPTFSPKGLLIRSGFPVKVHCEVLIYQTLTAHLTLHVYLVTSDPNIIQKVEKKEKDAIKIDKPCPERSLLMKTRYKIETRRKNQLLSSPIKPERLKLRYSPIKYCEVYVRNAEDDFGLHLVNEKEESVWDVEIRTGKFNSKQVLYFAAEGEKHTSKDFGKLI
ncbi:NACHT, LRR and PYD domains-containing protein 1b allele 5-like, partial [Astyanax mexicanus]